MSKSETRQHVVLDDDVHRAVSILASENGCSNGDIVTDILQTDNQFKKKLNEVRRKMS